MSSVNPNKPVDSSKPPEPDKNTTPQPAALSVDANSKIAAGGHSPEVANKDASLKDKKVSAVEGVGSASSSAPAVQRDQKEAVHKDAPQTVPSESNSKKNAVKLQEKASWENMPNVLKKKAMEFLNVKALSNVSTVDKESKSFAENAPIWKQLAASFGIQIPHGVTPKNAVTKFLIAVNNRFKFFLDYLKQDPAILVFLKELNKESSPDSQYTMIQNFFASHPDIAERLLRELSQPNSAAMGLEGNIDHLIIKTLISSLTELQDFIPYLAWTSNIASADSKATYQQELIKACTDRIIALNDPNNEHLFDMLHTFLLFAPEAAPKSFIHVLTQNRVLPANFADFLIPCILNGRNQNVLSEILRHSDAATQEQLLKNCETSESHIHEIAAIRRGLVLLTEHVLPLLGERIRKQQEYVKNIFSFIQIAEMLNTPANIQPTDFFPPFLASCYKPGLASLDKHCFKPGLASSEELEKVLIENGLPKEDVQRILKDLGSLEAYEDQVSNTVKAAKQQISESISKHTAKQEDVKKDKV